MSKAHREQSDHQHDPCIRLRNAAALQRFGGGGLAKVVPPHIAVAGVDFAVVVSVGGEFATGLAERFRQTTESVASTAVPVVIAWQNNL